jgi:hypothetical protein
MLYVRGCDFNPVIQNGSETSMFSSCIFHGHNMHDWQVPDVEDPYLGALKAMRSHC